MPLPAVYPGLAEKTVFITGGGSGIGAALTAGFAAQRARVAFVDIAEAESTELAGRIGAETGHKPLFIRCDLRDIEALRAAIEHVREQFGDIGVLVNNAANDERQKAADVTVGDWDEKMAVNLRPMFFSSQAVLPHMQRLGGGAIVNFSSIAPAVKTPDLAAYITAKSAIKGLTRALARDFGPYNIRVNTLSPGWTMTKRQVDLWANPERLAARDRGQCLLGSILPEDVANLALFLSSDAAAKCTAQEFVVDAGWS